MLTEEEARGKWCPFTRVVAFRFRVIGRRLTEDEINSRPIAAINRLESGEGLNGTYCSASACMAWRWHDGHVRGYCGLAGEPTEVMRAKQAMAGDQPAQRRGSVDPRAPNSCG